MTSDRLKEILERKAEERRAARNLERRVDEKKQGAVVERSVDRVLFQRRYDRATEAAERALKNHRKVTEDGLARGFLKRDEMDWIVETTPDADRDVRPGEKIARGHTKGLENKERSARLARVSEAVMWASFAYGAEHSYDLQAENWVQPRGGADDRPAEKLTTNDLKLTNEAKERAREQKRSRENGGPSI